MNGPTLHHAQGYAASAGDADVRASISDAGGTMGEAMEEALAALGGALPHVDVRTKYIAPDFRRRPKTQHFCYVCQRDLNPTRPWRVIVVDPGFPLDAIHPDSAMPEHDRFPVGMDCARRIGLEWSCEPNDAERAGVAMTAPDAPRDPVYGLPVVGRGPEFHTTGASHWWRFRLKSLNPGDAVDVLLDDGRIVRSTLRGLRVVKMLRRVRVQVWVAGITGSYADGRIRPADGWWRTSGCVRCTP